jgi:glycosyltransferase involved in cell wall biosynthesis
MLDRQVPLVLRDQYQVEDTVVTFIIPSVGRSTLGRTLASLQAQDIPRWRAVVIFDGVSPVCPENAFGDSRIVFTWTPKIGSGNHGARVRNVAFEKGLTWGDWVAFVDDDDTVTPDYINRLLLERSRDEALEVVIFRMLRGKRIIPRPGRNRIVRNDVGISFAVRTSVLERFRFKPSCTEDFAFLHEMEDAGLKMKISEYVTYHVG